MNRAVFLDRDGVINRKAPEGQYITRWADFKFLPGAAEAIAALNEAGFRVIVVTNQRCVAKGLLTTPGLESIHEQMCRQLAGASARLAAVYYCPHDTDPPCSCRKPSPTMLLTAAREHDVDLTASWMIGDSEIDIEAGRRAGCRTVRVLHDASFVPAGAGIVAGSLLDAVGLILGTDANRRPTVRETGG